MHPFRPLRGIWDDAINGMLLRDGLICWRRRSSVLYTSPYHRHLGIGMLYCEDGAGVFLLGERVFPYAAGRLVLFDSQVPHQVIMHRGYDRWDLCFLPEIMDFPHELRRLAAEPGRVPQGSSTARLYQIGDSATERLRRLLEDVADEVRQKRKGFDKVIALRLAELFILIDRYGQYALEEAVTLPQHPPSCLDEILTYIEDRLDDPHLTVEAVARHFHYSSSHFYRLMLKATGQTPSQYIKARRVSIAQRLLIETSLTVTQVARATGFENVAHFCHVFRAASGTTPTEYRRAAATAPGSSN